jgi:hypothetical protein
MKPGNDLAVVGLCLSARLHSFAVVSPGVRLVMVAPLNQESPSSTHQGCRAICFSAGPCSRGHVAHPTTQCA